MADEQQRRQVACKVKISEITTGKYVKEEGWRPNYVLTDSNIKVSRVNFICAVVDVPVNEGETFESVVVDDGSAIVKIIEENKEDRKMMLEKLGKFIGEMKEKTKRGNK